MKYRTISGDTWDAIADKAAGDAMRAGALMGANPALLSFVVFPAGVELEVPETAAARQKFGLPPWKRGDV
jgi:phage tail protein X